MQCGPCCLSCLFVAKLLSIVTGYVSEGIGLLNILPILDKKFLALYQLGVQFLSYVLEILLSFYCVYLCATKEDVFMDGNNKVKLLDSKIYLRRKMSH